MTEQGKHILVRAGVWTARILVGLTFVVSGFVKAIDPWGTFYKIKAYFDYWHIDWGDGLPLFGAVALSSVEFLGGVMVLTGCYRKVAAWSVSAVMLFMLPLSLWIAISNPVSDCGCFGDFIILSNQATFWKNVVLSAGCVWLLMRNTRCPSLINPYLQWIGFVASLVFILGVAWTGYFQQPVIDFRPYAVGRYLWGGSEDDPAGDNFVFIYEKAGETKEFSIDDTLPDEESGWKFVGRRQTGKPDIRIASETRHTPDLQLWDERGEEDITESSRPVSDMAFIVVIPDLKDLSMSVAWKLNGLYDLCSAHDIEMIAVASANAKDIEAWRDLSLAEYPIYTSEDTVLKETVRGNPGVIMTDKGRIVWKSTLTAIDSRCLDGVAEEASEEMSDLRPEIGETLWYGLRLWYPLIMGILIAVSAGIMLRKSLQRVSPAHQHKAPQADCSPSKPSERE